MPMLTNVRATMLPLVVIRDGSFNLMSSFNNSIFVLSATLTMVYFFFSFDKLSSKPGILRASRWLMMLSFGVSFGNTVMNRLTLLMGRLTFLFGDWLGLI